MVSVSGSLSVDVVAAVVTGIAREATEDGMPERARKVHHLGNSLLNCEFPVYLIVQVRPTNARTAVVDSDVVLAVVELLPLLNCLFVQLACASDRHYRIYS
jgi:hypothetical protein